MFHLVQHGTIMERSGIQFVINALALLDKSLSFHFDVVGEGEYQPFLESGLHNSVCKIGSLSTDINPSRRYWRY